jgi:hypothetical protein
VSGSELIADPSSLDPVLGGWGIHRRNERVLEDKLLAIKTLFTIMSEYSETEEGTPPPPQPLAFMPNLTLNPLADRAVVAVAGALGYFPYVARTYQLLQDVIHNTYDQECHIFGPTCFPPLITILRKGLEWRIKNGTLVNSCGARARGRECQPQSG